MTATPHTIRWVPNSEISTKPVANVPTMLPTVPAAEIRPTVLPVCARSRTASLVTTGEMVPSRTLGRKKSAAVSARMRTIMGQSPGTRRPSTSAARIPVLSSPADRNRMPSSRNDPQRSASLPPR